MRTLTVICRSFIFAYIWFSVAEFCEKDKEEKRCQPKNTGHLSRLNALLSISSWLAKLDKRKKKRFFYPGFLFAKKQGWGGW